jgi:hypothetical protein
MSSGTSSLSRTLSSRLSSVMLFMSIQNGTTAGAHDALPGRVHAGEGVHFAAAAPLIHLPDGEGAGNRTRNWICLLGGSATQSPEVVVPMDTGAGFRARSAGLVRGSRPVPESTCRRASVPQPHPGDRSERFARPGRNRCRSGSGPTLPLWPK